MKIIITGATGLLGSHLAKFFLNENHEVWAVTRSSQALNNPKLKQITWDIKSKKIDIEKLEGADVVIHLAGANIASGRWTKALKAEILNSRVDGTRFISNFLAGLKSPPKLFISASAIGFYGYITPHASIDEKYNVGNDFLADVCRQWEAATQPTQISGIRTIQLRIGTVISTKGGALGKMLPPFRLGLGGVIGTGKQPFSWIYIEEIPHVIKHLINSKLSGPVNCASPETVSNFRFTKLLGKVIKKPTIFPLPAFVVKTLFGEMGEVLLLNGAVILPKKLIDDGYQFKYSNLEEALKDCFKNAY